MATRLSRLASYKCHTVIPNAIWLAETKMANREGAMNRVRKAREGRPYSQSKTRENNLETND